MTEGSLSTTEEVSSCVAEQEEEGETGMTALSLSISSREYRGGKLWYKIRVLIR